MSLEEEYEIFFSHLKRVVFRVAPLTILGYLFIVAAYAFGVKGNVTIEYLAEIARTGIMVSILALLYYLGFASWLLVNDLISRFTSEKRIKEEP